MNFNFTLNQTSLTLVNNLTDFKGVTLQTQDLKVSLKMYDGTNKYNKKTLDADLMLMTYGLWVNFKDESTGQIDYSPFMQKLAKLELTGPSSKPEASPKVEEDDEFFDCADEERKQNEQFSAAETP